MSLVEYYQEVALLALAFAQVDVTRGVLDMSRQVEVCDSVERVVADLSDHIDVPNAQTEDGSPYAAPDILAARAPMNRASKSEVGYFASLAERRSTKLPAPFSLSFWSAEASRLASQVQKHSRQGAFSD